jgi:hypothetical protein
VAKSSAAKSSARRLPELESRRVTATVRRLAKWPREY